MQNKTEKRSLFMAENDYCNLVGGNKIKDEFFKINNGFGLVQAAIQGILKMLGNEEVWSGIGSDPDEAGINTVISYKRKDGTLFLKLTLTNKSTEGMYQNVTVVYYAADGVTVVSENTYNIPLTASEG
jgi:hypothetical protein